METSDYKSNCAATGQPASNPLFERHLHAECRSHFYAASGSGPGSGSGSGAGAGAGPGYDSLDRLLGYQRGLLASGGGSVQQPISLPSTDASRDYNVDLMGNWVDQGGTPAVRYTPACGRQKQESRTTNDLNQILTRNSTGLQYDNNGNLTFDGTLGYTVDALDRVATVSAADGTPLANYYYDAGHRRVRKVVNDLGGGLGGIDGDAPAGTTDYCYDGPEVLEERDPTNGDAVLRQFVWGEGEDDLIQQRESADGPQKNYYPLTDHLGRTVALVDGQGNVICAFDTDAYGRTLVYINPGPDGKWFTDDDVLLNKQTAEAGNVPPLCPYVFTGQRLDLESKLYYYKARHYNPSLGRFVQRDPIGYAGGMNLYEYCGGMPTAATDPSGEQATSGIPVGSAGAPDLGPYALPAGPGSARSSNPGLFSPRRKKSHTPRFAAELRLSVKYLYSHHIDPSDFIEAMVGGSSTYSQHAPAGHYASAASLGLKHKFNKNEWLEAGVSLGAAYSNLLKFEGAKDVGVGVSGSARKLSFLGGTAAATGSFKWLYHLGDKGGGSTLDASGKGSYSYPILGGKKFHLDLRGGLHFATRKPFSMEFSEGAEYAFSKKMLLSSGVAESRGMLKGAGENWAVGPVASLHAGPLKLSGGLYDTGQATASLTYHVTPYISFGADVTYQALEPPDGAGAQPRGSTAVIWHMEFK